MNTPIQQWPAFMKKIDARRAYIATPGTYYFTSPGRFAFYMFGAGGSPFPKAFSSGAGGGGFCKKIITISPGKSVRMDVGAGGQCGESKDANRGGTTKVIATDGREYLASGGGGTVNGYTDKSVGIGGAGSASCDIGTHGGNGGKSGGDHSHGGGGGAAGPKGNGENGKDRQGNLHHPGSGGGGCAWYNTGGGGGGGGGESNGSSGNHGGGKGGNGGFTGSWTRNDGFRTYRGTRVPWWSWKE